MFIFNFLKIIAIIVKHTNQKDVKALKKNLYLAFFTGFKLSIAEDLSLCYNKV